MEEVIPLFKSHFSIGKSILTLDSPSDPIDPTSPDSIFDIVKENDIKEIFLVEDSMAGFLEAYTKSEELGVKLVFGLRLGFCPDLNNKSEEGRKNSFKNIIFIKNQKGYKQLIKICTKAAQDGFYYEPRMDFKTLKEFWTNDLLLAVPFYDSFLYNNKYTDSQCVPDFSFCDPIFIKEDNDTLLDDDMNSSVDKFCKDKYETFKGKSIYYKTREDFSAYLTHRCINKRTSLQKPNFDGMCSNEFCYESYSEVISG